MIFRIALVTTVLIAGIPFLGYAQTQKASVVPQGINRTVGDFAYLPPQKFQLVESSGRVVDSGVEWQWAPSDGIEARQESGTLTIVAKAAGTVRLTAFYGGESYKATMRVWPKGIPNGYTKWWFEPLRGRLSDHVSSVRVDEKTPDYYYEDSNQEGALIRAFDDLGSQMWTWPGPETTQRVQMMCADNRGGVLVLVSDGGETSLVSIDKAGQERWRRQTTATKAAYSVAPDGTILLYEAHPREHLAFLVGLDEEAGRERFAIGLPASYEVTKDASGAECTGTKRNSPAPHTNLFSDADGFVHIALLVSEKEQLKPKCGSAATLKTELVQKIVHLKVDLEHTTSTPYVIESQRGRTSWRTSGMLIPDGNGGLLISLGHSCEKPCHSDSTVYRITSNESKEYELVLPEFTGESKDQMLLGEKDVGYVSHGSYIVAFDVLKGKEVWRWRANAGIVDLEVALADGSVLADYGDSLIQVGNGKLQETLPGEWLNFNLH